MHPASSLGCRERNALRNKHRHKQTADLARGFAGDGNIFQIPAEVIGLQGSFPALPFGSRGGSACQNALWSLELCLGWTLFFCPVQPSPAQRSPARSPCSRSNLFPGMCAEPPSREPHLLLVLFVPILGAPHKKASPKSPLLLLKLSFLWGLSRVAGVGSDPTCKPWFAPLHTFLEIQAQIPDRTCAEEHTRAWMLSPHSAR